MTAASQEIHLGKFFKSQEFLADSPASDYSILIVHVGSEHAALENRSDRQEYDCELATNPVAGSLSCNMETKWLG